MKSNKPQKSPLRYPGGKTRACQLLESIIESKFGIPMKIYSPFFGGGSFELFMNGKYNSKIIGNDAFKPLYTFWKVVSERPDELIKLIHEIKVNMNKEKFLEFRKYIMNENDELKVAAYYFALNRCSFSGATLSGGFSKESENKRFNESAIKRIENCKMNNVIVMNDDFNTFLSKIPINDEFIFLDPPYFIESKLYGYSGDMHENFNHDLLANTIKNKKKWLLCYNDCEYIRNLYKDYEIVDISWSYGMNKSKKSSEIIILSKHNTI